MHLPAILPCVTTRMKLQSSCRRYSSYCRSRVSLAVPQKILAAVRSCISSRRCVRPCISCPCFCASLVNQKEFAAVGAVTRRVSPASSNIYSSHTPTHTQTKPTFFQHPFNFQDTHGPVSSSLQYSITQEVTRIHRPIERLLDILLL